MHKRPAQTVGLGLVATICNTCVQPEARLGTLLGTCAQQPLCDLDDLIKEAISL